MQALASLTVLLLLHGTGFLAQPLHCSNNVEARTVAGAAHRQYRRAWSVSLRMYR